MTKPIRSPFADFVDGDAAGAASSGAQRIEVSRARDPERGRRAEVIQTVVQLQIQAAQMLKDIEVNPVRQGGCT